MNVRPGDGKWPADHHVLRLEGDELLCRVPSTGIDEALLEEMVFHRVHEGGAVHAPQNKKQTRPDFAPWHLVPQPAHRRFEVYAQMNPGASALKFDRTELTYGELDSQADGLAVLLQRYGVGPSDLCAICMERSLAMVRAILAVLKAGGAYLHLDPALPARRMPSMLRAANARTVITQEAYSDRFVTANARVILSDEGTADLPDTWPQDCSTQRFSPAYASYQLSETENPIIVVRDHMDVIEQLESMQKLSPIGQGDSLLQSADYAFDESLWEFLWPLTHGARLVIPTVGETMDFERMRLLIVKEHITVMHVNLR